MSLEHHIFSESHLKLPPIQSEQLQKYNTHKSTSELRSYVTVDVAVLGSPSLISLIVSSDVKLH